MHYDTDTVQKNSNKNAENLPVHDDDFPEVVIALVAIIKKAELLLDCGCIQIVRVFPHHHKYN